MNSHKLRSRLAELTLAVLATASCAAIALGVLRSYAPDLLGISTDRQLVKTGERIAAFYDGIFRPADYMATEIFLKDPGVVTRGRPRYEDRLLYGPHDVLGFRNRAVPNRADIVAIGDSQTYGHNAPLEESWPSQLLAGLPRATYGVYNISLGAWNAVQYLEMSTKATFLNPQLVVVAFYSGNDAIGSARLAYADERWADLRPASVSDPGPIEAPSFPPPADENWSATFSGGLVTTFTPRYRLAANDRTRVAVQAGYGVMARAAEEIAAILGPAGIAVVFTVIPTKELVFASDVAREALAAPPEYTRLVEHEAAWIDWLSERIATIENARYADLLGPLQAIADKRGLYPESADGHPLPAGYRAIADALRAAMVGLLRDKPRGVLRVRASPLPGHTAEVYYLTGRSGLMRFADPHLVFASGWRADQIVDVPMTLAESFPFSGEVIRTANPAAVGPHGSRLASARPARPVDPLPGE